MIARLSGRVEELGAEHAVIDVAGVGYLLSCSARTLAQLPKPGEAAKLYVETRLREDALTLFGFATAEEKRWFRLLTSVQGVGPKSALALLSALAPEELLRAVAAEDRVPLTRADGIGGKLAARIVNELKDKVAAGGFAPASAGAPLRPEDALAADAVSALVHLGYGRSEAFDAVATVRAVLGERATLSTLVPAALKELAA
ncbi:MAG: Holliday junction branch migration protein RuvA [Alphaproteobacteria bacterium]|nr:Holliday junction branch migration protein RuvA [Alphaproteobacteria bacterium]